MKIRKTKKPTPRRAYLKKDLEQSLTLHEEKLAAPHEKHHNEAAHLGDMVLGGIDGIITTFAIVAGVEGANLNPSYILVLGFANIIADGVSMAVGNYLATKSDEEYYKSERAREIWEVEHMPEHEKEEVRRIYASKGFEGELLEKVVDKIVENETVWVDTMMREELNMQNESKSPFFAAVYTFVAFILFGSIPMLAYMYAYIFSATSENLFLASWILSGCALFIVGALRSKFTAGNWFRSGLEILLLGGLAGSLSYIVGASLKSMIQ